MDFEFNDEQRLLNDSAYKFIQNAYDFEKRRQWVASGLGFSRDHWQHFAEMGWLAIPFAEEDGGIGGGPVELIGLMEELGKGLTVEPFVPTVVLAGGVLARAGNEQQKNDWLNPLIAGEVVASLALFEGHQGFDWHDTRLRATRQGDQVELNGSKPIVWYGAQSDYWVVTALDDQEELLLLIVRPDTDGVKVSDYQLADEQRAAEITFTNARVSTSQLLASGERAREVLEATVYDAIIALSAEALGAMQVLLTETVEYSKTRKQFGQPIGKFQVLQHRMADMYMEIEKTRSLLYAAAIKWRDGARDAETLITALKAQVGRAGKKVGQQAVQLHGGMGMTDELKIGHYFKRLLAIDVWFGNRDFHLEKLARQLAS